MSSYVHLVSESDKYKQVWLAVRNEGTPSFICQKKLILEIKMELEWYQSALSGRLYKFSDGNDIIRSAYLRTGWRN